jgi:hypothetical protein
MPFAPSPSLRIDAVAVIRKELPSGHIMDALLNTFHNAVEDVLLPAFSRKYVQSNLIPIALSGKGHSALVALTSLFAILAIGALFAVDGPGEAREVARFGTLSTSAMGASGMLSSPSLELVEGVFARSILELFRQGSLEEPARYTFAIAAQMCLAVSVH